MRIESQGEELDVLAEKALYWHRLETLFVADLHLGKAATFRAYGAPVPETATYETLDRLTHLVDRIQPRKLVILGDLFHAREGTIGAPRDAFLAWRERHQGLDLDLIVGNHDRRAFPEHERGEWRDLIHEPPFTYAHHPEILERYVLCGHIHPGYRLRARGHRSECLPCFWFCERFAVIPAFGSFTGMAMVDPGPGDRVFLVVNEEILALPTF